MGLMRASAFVSTIALSVAAILSSGSASAASFSNVLSWNGIDEMFPFGSPDSTSYGEVFKSPGYSLSSFGFLIDTEGNSGNAKFVLAKWDGAEAVGPAIYTSPEFTIDSHPGYNWNVISGIGALLTPGERYIAFLTVAGTANPINQPTQWAITSTPGTIGGGFYYLNSAGADPFSTAGPWSAIFSDEALVYKAEFALASTPLPPGLPLFAAALCSFGFVGWRQRKHAT